MIELSGFLNGLFNGIANVAISFIAVNIYLELLKKSKPTLLEILSLYTVVFASLFRASLDFNNMMEFNSVGYTVVFAILRNYATLFILMYYKKIITKL